MVSADTGRTASAKPVARLDTSMVRRESVGSTRRLFQSESNWVISYPSVRGWFGAAPWRFIHWRHRSTNACHRDRFHIRLSPASSNPSRRSPYCSCLELMSVSARGSSLPRYRNRGRSHARSLHMPLPRQSGKAQLRFRSRVPCLESFQIVPWDRIFRRNINFDVSGHLNGWYAERARGDDVALVCVTAHGQGFIGRPIAC